MLSASDLISLASASIALWAYLRSREVAKKTLQAQMSGNEIQQKMQEATCWFPNQGFQIFCPDGEIGRHTVLRWPRFVHCRFLSLFWAPNIIPLAEFW